VTGQIEETHRLYSGDRERVGYDAFGREVQMRVQPSGEPESVVAEQVYIDLVQSPIGHAYTERFVRIETGDLEGIRSAAYLDGFGRTVRCVDDAPEIAGAARYLGTATRLDPGQRIATQTFAAACSAGGTDPHCLGLIDGPQPRTITTTDGLGRPVRIDTPEGIARLDYRSVTRAHPDTGTRTFDVVLTMDPRGALTQRILDGDRVVWVEQCNGALLDPETADLSTAGCASPDVTFYRYAPTGELAEIYDAAAQSVYDPGQATLRLVLDTLGRTLETHDINKAAPTFTEYDAAGNVAREINARGQATDFDYDPLGGLTETRLPTPDGLRSYALTYDPSTRSVAQVDHTLTPPGGSPVHQSTETFAYDALGRQVRKTLQVGSYATLVLETDLDLLGRPTVVRYPDAGTDVAYEYAGAYLRRVRAGRGRELRRCGGHRLPLRSRLRQPRARDEPPGSPARERDRPERSIGTGDGARRSRFSDRPASSHGNRHAQHRPRRPGVSNRPTRAATPARRKPASWGRCAASGYEGGLRLALERPEHNEGVAVLGPAGSDLLGGEAELRPYLADRAAPELRDAAVRDGEEAADQLDPVRAAREVPELASDHVVLGAAEHGSLGAGDLDDKDGLRLRQPAVPADEVLHRADLVVGHLEVRVGDAGQHVGERGEVARPVRLELVELGGDAADGGRIAGRVRCGIALAEAEETQNGTHLALWPQCGPHVNSPGSRPGRARGPQPRTTSGRRPHRGATPRDRAAAPIRRSEPGAGRAGTRGKGTRGPGEERDMEPLKKFRQEIRTWRERQHPLVPGLQRVGRGQ
jgi:YD repeat-containing protein